MKTNPPRLPARLLRYFSSNFSTDDIQGDLYELFFERSHQSLRRAQLLFWRDTILALPTLWKLARRFKRKHHQKSASMLTTNLKLSVRHMLKRPGYSFTTVFGLALGVAVCFLIFYYIHFELSFDKFHANADRIVAVNYEFVTPANQTTSPSVPDFVGPKIARLFPEVIAQCRILPGFGTQVVHYNDKVFEESEFAYSDSTFFSLFSFHLVDGSPGDQLKRPNTALITSAFAKKYFGDENPVGKTITIGSKEAYEITGVMENIPANSHFTFDYILSISTLKLPEEEIWNSPNYCTYLLLQPGVDQTAFEDKVNTTLLDKDERLKESHVALHIQPFTAIHFDTTVAGYKNKVTDKRYIVVFSIVALLILFIASINYVNLATARATERGREVGIRKVAGATPKQLFRQFIMDSVVHILPAIALAAAFFVLLAPWLDSGLGLDMGTANTIDVKIILLIGLGIFFIVTVLAGFYPAVVLSRFLPSNVLKGKFNFSASASSLRKSLVVFQFCISIGLIVSTLIISSQLEFMQSAKLGFETSHTLILPLDNTMQKSFTSLRSELLKLSPVEAVVPVNAPPTEIVIGYGAYVREDQKEIAVVGALRTNADCIGGLGMKLLQGRNFDATREGQADVKPQYIVNQTFLKTFNFTPDEILGKNIWLGTAGGEGEVIGIVEDFHTTSLQKKIEPVVLYDQNGWLNKMLVKLHPGDVTQQLDLLSAQWKTLVPHRPFTYTFLDENYERLYANETRVSYLLKGFSTLAIFIACIGILGLVSYATVQRTKEIGIRKVLGASVLQVMYLISKDFIKLILIAFVLAVPLAYYAGSSWLQNFEYHIGIDPMFFITAGVFTFGLAIITISYQAIKASGVNPANTLRSE